MDGEKGHLLLGSLTKSPTLFPPSQNKGKPRGEVAEPSLHSERVFWFSIVNDPTLYELSADPLGPILESVEWGAT